MKSIVHWVLLTFVCASQNGFGQEVMLLEDAISQALRNNYQIKVLRNQQQIAENSANMGNAGLLPTVSVGGSAGGSINNTDLEFAGNLPPVSIDGARSTNITGNATVNYVLFDGFSGQRNFQKLLLNKLAVDELSRATIEVTILQVAQAYYGASLAEDQLRIAKENASISNDRYIRAKLANELGSNSNQELLAARVDLTSDSAAYLNAELQTKTTRRNLMRLVGLDINAATGLAPIEIAVQDWTIEQLEASALQQNATLKNIELQSALAEKDLQLSKSTLFPTLVVNGGYQYNNQQTEAGILLSNTSYGWTGNVGLSYNIFEGFRNNTTRQNAQIQLESSQLQFEDQKLQLRAELANAFDAYKQSIKLLQFEIDNFESSAVNLERARESLRNGMITSTQFREAQLGYVSAQVRISNAKISMKLNELEVMRLTGQILSTGG